MGHGPVAAAKLPGMREVPTVRLSHLSDTEKPAYILVDNKLAEKGWDREILAIELQALVDLNFDVHLSGFEPAELDLVLEEYRKPATHLRVRRTTFQPMRPVRSSAVRATCGSLDHTACCVSRLDDKVHGAIVIVMQRLHMEDLTGHLQEKGGFEIWWRDTVGDGRDDARRHERKRSQQADVAFT
jgi:hypothetical protein